MVEVVVEEDMMARHEQEAAVSFLAVFRILSSKAVC
jgi:hypothetical protein